MKIIFLLLFCIILNSCGYPDLDSVPDFKKVIFTDAEILDYCSNTNTDKKNIDICVNDYKSRK